MKKVIFFKIIPILIFLFIWTISLQAQTVYVNSSTGNDASGNGSSGSPYKTFTKGYSETASGGTLDLTGTFTWTDAAETGDDGLTGFTISKNVTIQGPDGGLAVVQAATSLATRAQRIFNIPTGYNVILKNLELRYGYTSATTDLDGGAIVCSSTLTILNCYIHDNIARQGCGIEIGGTAIIENTTISNNISTAAQSGLSGGGILLGGGNLTLTNSTIYNNSGVQYGGGIYARNSGGTLKITNCTITDNSAPNYDGSNTGMGGGIGIEGSTVSIKNTIVANNSEGDASNNGDDIDKYSGTITDNGYNIVEVTNSGSITGTGDITGNQSNLFGTGVSSTPTLADNGTLNGPPTIALSSGSVAINAGDGTANGSVSVPTTDQRGLGRNGNTDIGAYEFGGTAANATPVATAPSAPTVTEDDTNVAIDNDIQVDDTDGDDQTVSFTITGGTVTIGTAGITFGGNGNGSSSFTAQGTLAAINTALDAATFTPTANVYGANAGTIAFTSNDGTDNSNAASVSFNITGVNDEPTLTATGTNPTFTEDGAAATLYNSASASTIEGGQTITGFVLTVTNVSDGSAERLNVDGTSIILTNGTNGTTANNSLDYSVSVTGSTATVTFSGGTVSTADFQTLINGITYQNNSNTPNTSNRVVTITSMTDSGGTEYSGDDTVSLTIVSTVSVVTNNDAPTLSSFAGVVETTTQNTEVEITLAELKAQGNEADVDGTVNAFIVKTLSTGTLKIGANSGAAIAFNATTNNTINAANNAYWTPTTDAYGELNAFTTTVMDDGGAESAVAVQAKVQVNDVTFPSVSSITKSGTPTATSVTFVVAFSEWVVNVSTDDFSLASTGSASGTIASVSASSGSSIDVTVNTISGTGTLRLDLKSSTNIADASANTPPAAFTSGSVHNVDLDNPTLSSSVPADGANGVSASANITLTFSENIAFGTGNIRIIDLDDATGNITIDAASPGVLASITNNVLTINPSSDLEENTNYAVQIAATAIDDVNGNSYAGITDNTTLNFTVKALPTIAFNSTSSNGLESVSSANLQVSLSAISEFDVIVDYAVTGTATGGGTDYTLANGTLTITAGNTTANITIAGIVNDVLDENNETVIVTLSNPTYANLGVNTVHTYTITDNDASPTIAFNSTTSSGLESVNSANLQVNLSTASGLAVTVDYVVTGTATGGGTDYTLANGTLTINAGDLNKNITIAGIVNDLIDEDNETVIVTLSNPTYATLGANTVHTYTITDDENPEISITGNGNNISDGSTSPLTTNYTDFGNTDLTAGEVTHTFTITNSGIGALHLTGTTPFVTISGHTSDFTVISAPTTPVSASSGTTTFSIKFDPTTTGLREATISIDNDDEDENPFTFDIQGTGGNYPEIKVEYSGTEIVDGDATPAIAEGTDFGYDHYNYSAYSPVHTFQIVNQGSGTLNLSGTPRVTVTGIDFSLEQDAPTSIAAGDTAEFKVKFAATAVVTRSGNVSITNNDSGENPYNFSITGTGYTGSLMIVQGGSPQQDIENGDNTPVEDDYTDFGRTTIDGGTIDRIFEIENYGDGNLTLSGTPVVIITGADESEFTVTDQSSSTIGSGSNDTFTIQFDPSGSGTKTATVSIANNDPNRDPYTFTINGDGGAPPTGQNETITINEDETHTFAVSEFTFNDTDGDTFAGIKIESLETAGELKYNGTDVTIGMDCPDVTLLLYTPEFNENASPYASFTYKLKDDQGVYSDIAYSMIINVNSVIDPPVVVVNSGISVNEGGMIIISDANLKSNDSDGEVSALNYEIKSEPFHGVLNSNGFTQNAIANGEVKYTHDGTEAPVDSFMFVVKDNDGGVSEESTFLITVVGINDPPVFTGVIAFTMNEDEELTLSKSTLLGYVSDPDDPDSLLSVSFTSCCEYMHVSQSDNNYLVTCTENWCGIGECKISVSDGEFTIDTTVNIMVNEVNDLPVLTGLPAGVEFVQNGSATIDLNGTASDIETPDSLLVFSFMAVPDSVNTTFNNDTKILTLTSFGGFTGSVLLTITVTDEDAGTAEEDINVTVHSNVTGIERLDGIPEDYTLYQNYPNPFNPVTKIRFGIPEESEVSLRIYDVLGREVTTLINSTQGAGYYNYNWNATNNASGIYFYVLTARSLNQDYREIKKMLLIK